MNGVKTSPTTTQAYLQSNQVKETKNLITELCRQFYTLGWVSGTGGSITIKVHDDCIPKPQQLILMSPSGTFVISLITHLFFFITYMFLAFVYVLKSDFYVFLGVQKERMVDEDMYVLSSTGSVLFSPLPKPYPHKAPKCSDCAPLFMKVRLLFTCNFMVFLLYFVLEILIECY